MSETPTDNVVSTFKAIKNRLNREGLNISDEAIATLTQAAVMERAARYGIPVSIQDIVRTKDA